MTDQPTVTYRVAKHAIKKEKKMIFLPDQVDKSCYSISYRIYARGNVAVGQGGFVLKSGMDG